MTISFETFNKMQTTDEESKSLRLRYTLKTAKI